MKSLFLEQGPENLRLWDQDQSPASQPPGAASLLRDGLIGTRGPRPCLAGEGSVVVCKGLRPGTPHQGLEVGREIKGLEVGREIKEEEDLASPSGVLD